MTRRTLLSLTPAAIAAPVFAKALPAPVVPKASPGVEDVTSHSSDGPWKEYIAALRRPRRITKAATRRNALTDRVQQDPAASKWLFGLMNRHVGRCMCVTSWYSFPDVRIKAFVRFDGDNVPVVEIS